MTGASLRLRELPPGAVTGVGSLPFLNPGDAVRFVRSVCPLIPFWPQLPMRAPEEDLVSQSLAQLKRWLEVRADGRGFVLKQVNRKEFEAELREGSPHMLPHEASGFFEFAMMLEVGLFHEAEAIKGQITGPVTLACNVHDERGEPLSRDPEMLSLFGAYVARLAQWQAKKLTVRGLPTLILVDEHDLVAVDQIGAERHGCEDAINTVLRTLRAEGAYGGIHCGSNELRDEMQTIEADLFSLNVIENMHEACRLAKAHPDALIAYGLVPLGKSMATVSPESLFTWWLSITSEADDLYDLAQRALVTTSEGLGRSTPDVARRAFEKCERVGEYLRQIALESYVRNRAMAI